MTGSKKALHTHTHPHTPPPVQAQGTVAYIRREEILTTLQDHYYCFVDILELKVCVCVCVCVCV